MYRPEGLDILIYLRKSRKDLEEEKRAADEGRHYDTLERHRLQLLAVAKKERHNILEIYEEIVSGEFISERPKMQELIREVEQGNVEGVLVMDLDRLGRGDMLDQGIIDRTFRYSGTKILTPTELYNPEDETWELVFGIKSLVAREELKTINKRLNRGRRQSASEGKHIGKKPPYGYLRDENLKLYPDPDTAWVVQKIFNQIIDGKGRRQIAAELNQLGIPSPSGQAWSLASIRNIIQNEVYQGDMVWRKKKHIKQNGKYIVRPLPKEEWVIKENAHEPIVSKEVFKLANETVSARYIPPRNETKAMTNALAGVLKCGLCGYTMWRKWNSYRPQNKDRTAASVYCSNIECRRHNPSKGASYERVEERVLQGLQEIVDRYKIQQDREEVSQDYSKLMESQQKAIEKKEKELQELEKQKDNLHDLLERGVYDIDTFMARQQTVTERIKQTKEEVAQLQQDMERVKLQEKSQNEFIPKIKSVLEAYRQTDDIEKKNRLLKSVLEKATYFRDLTWKDPDHFVIELYLRI